MKRFIFVFLVFLSVFSAFADFYKTNVTVSYYADAFHGKKTSSGETFNMYDFTCAHKMLPFGTKVKVTNLKNGKSVIVRVNDRGPFVKTREMDLSKAAAVNLGMIGSGTAKANLEIISLGKNTKQSEQTAKKACQLAGIAYNSNFSNSVKSASGTKSASVASSSSNSSIKQASGSASKSDDSLWDIQVGSFSSKSNANNLAQKLLRDGFSDVVFQNQKGDDSIIRVVIRKIPSENLAKVEKNLSEKGYSDFLVKKRS